MSETKNLNVSPFQLSFKDFLEKIIDESGLSEKELINYKIMLPILDKKTFNILKNYENLPFVLEKRTNDELNDQTYLNELNKIDLNLVQIETELNEFYAKTNVIQYYLNNLDKPIDLIIKFPNNSKIQFSKFTLEMNNKKVISKVIDKNKAEEKYTDAIASGNTGAFSSKELNEIKVNIGNIPGKSIVKLTSEFIQFLNIEDMSYCYSFMKNFPNFSSQNYDAKLQKIKVKIKVKTFSKITRLITKGFENNLEKKFNENYTQCNLYYYSLNKDIKKQLENDEFKLLFRTESMNKFNLITQYDKNKDETSCILSMVYNKNIIIPQNENPDTNNEHNYINLYQQNIINSNPSLFIFLLDQSGSMNGNPMKMLKESLIFFLQSLPKDSYYQLIGFGSNFKYIHSKNLLEYTPENVSKTISVIEQLDSNLGYTVLYKPLEVIFNNKKYENINLCRNLFILTDGYVEDKNKTLNLIKNNLNKFRIHSFGLGEHFDRDFIEKAGKNGSYNFITNTSKLKMGVIQTLNATLKSYLYNADVNVENFEKIIEYKPIDKVCYQDESLNYYFIVKNKINDNVKINIKYYEKNELVQNELIFDKNNIFYENDGDVISKIIIGNVLNNNFLDKNENIKLAKKYQVSSEYTSLYAEIENENPNINITNLQLIEQNKKENIKEKKKNKNKKENYYKIKCKDLEEELNEYKNDYNELKRKNYQLTKKINKMKNMFNSDSESDEYSEKDYKCGRRKKIKKNSESEEEDERKCRKDKKKKED